MGYLGCKEPPACILVKTSSGRVSLLDAGVSNSHKGKCVDIHEEWFGDGTSRFDTFDDLLSEGANVTIGGVEGDGDDWLGPIDKVGKW